MVIFTAEARPELSDAHGRLEIRELGLESLSLSFSTPAGRDSAGHVIPGWLSERPLGVLGGKKVIDTVALRSALTQC